MLSFEDEVVQNVKLITFKYNNKKINKTRPSSLD